MFLFGVELFNFISPSSSTTFKISEAITPKGTYICTAVIELVNNNVAGVELKVARVEPTNSPLPSQSNSPSQSPT